MKRQFVNGAMALLIALGVSACSSSTGSSASQSAVPTASTTATNTYVASTAENSSTDSSSTESSSTESSLTESSLTESSLTESSSTESSSTDSSSTESSSTESSSTESSSTESSSTESSSTESSSTENSSAENSSAENSSAENSSAESSESTASETTVTDAEQTDTTSTDESQTESSETTATVPSQILAGTNPSASDSSSALYKYLNDATDELLSAIESVGVATLSASCTSNASGACSSANKERGDVMIAKNQSYSSYAVIREDYEAEDVPANSYVAVNLDPVKAENIAKVSGTYTGQATYSGKNRPNALTRDFTMTVNDSGVSGEVYTTATNGNKTVWVSLNDTTLSVENGAVTFTGTATFNESTFGVADGTYQGSFAGNESEKTEVIGTFESSESTDAGSIQGAFAGTKE